MITFDRMVTPAIIQLAWLVGVFGSIYAGIRGGTWIYGVAEADTTSAYVAGWAAGIVIAIATAMVIRILCECLIVAFRIHSTLVEIREELLEARVQAAMRPTKQTPASGSDAAAAALGSMGR